MSRLYDFQVEAELPEGVDHVAVGKALSDYDSEFTPGWWAEGRLLSSDANISLYAGKTPDEAADEIAAALWRAAGRFFEVRISYCCLEDLPYETCIKDEDDHERLVIEPAAVPEIPALKRPWK